MQMTKAKTIKVKPYKNTPFRKAYQPRERVQIKMVDSRTEQSHVDDCDINKILSQYIKTGTFNANLIDKHQKLYGDYTGTDFEEAQNLIAKAQSLFEELPSIVRNRFNNSPAQFLDFAGDENNMTEMVEMGLANAPKREENTEPVEVLTETKADENPRDEQLST